MKESSVVFDGAKLIAEFKEYCAQFPKLALYGAGNNGKTIAHFMKREGIPFSCFCVSGKPKMDNLEGHPVMSFKDIPAPGQETGIIIAVSKDRGAQNIIDSLIDKGVNCFYSEQLITYLTMVKSRKPTDQIVIQDGYLIKAGSIAFQKSTQYIGCVDHIGDTVYVAGLIKEYKDAHPEYKKVCMIVSEYQKPLVTAFPSVDNIVVSDEVVKLLCAYLFSLPKLTAIVLKNFFFEPFVGVTRERNETEVNQGYVLDLPATAQFEKPVFNRDILKLKKPLPDIVIMPYAKSMKELPEWFWENLVQRLHEKKYSIGTNVGCKQEMSVPGTEAICEPLMDMAVLCENCKAVISLRSGICDLLAFTNTNLFIIYSDEMIQKEGNIKKLFPREGIHEFSCFREEDLDSLTNDLLAALESKDEK